MVLLRRRYVRQMCTTPTQRWTLPVLAASAALILGGCGDESGTSEAAADGPLAEFFGEGVIEFSPGGGMGMSFGASTGLQIPEEELERMREVEDLVADCMAGEGFEYTANVVDPNEWLSPWIEAQDLPPDEFAEQYGYGISTMHYSEIEQELPPDPNQEYRESLSDEAEGAYERALYGDREARSFTAGEDPPPVEARGCYGIASFEVYGEDSLGPVEKGADPWAEFEDLLYDINSLGHEIHADPRLEAAGQAWLSCMAEAGYPHFQQAGEPEQSIHERLGELEGWDEYADLSEGEMLDAEPPQIDPEELAKLQENEIELAVADHECMAAHYDDVFADVSNELQDEFVEEHRAELERYRDWAEENDFDGGFGYGFGEGVG